MIPESFHFLRPAWLLALVPAAAILALGLRSAASGSAWRRLVDEHLLRHLVADGEAPTRSWPLWALGIAWTAMCVAMAGPAWERIPEPAYTISSPTVVVLDVSPAMAVDDVSPSRLARARHELHDVLARLAGGQVALVLYTDEPFVAAPLTDDGRVIEEMIPSLTGRLMPGTGSHPERAIRQASALLDQAGAPRGEILLMTASAGDDPAATEAAANDARARGHELSILGIGSEEGAPARDARGRMVKGADGKPVLSRLDRDGLEALAAAGGGRFAVATPDDADLARVLRTPAQDAPAGQRLESTVRTDVWRDAGIWLVAIPLLLAPLAFRRGWLAAVAFAVLASGATDASAATWDDLWQTRDQQGRSALEAGQAAAAAELFESPTWQAASLYEAGQYPKAIEKYSALEGAENRYNLGNALARAGQLEPALAAYDAALKERPDDADAKFNRDLVQKLLDEQRRQQQEKEQQKEQQQQAAQENPQAQGQENANDREKGGQSGGGTGEDPQAQDGDPQEANPQEQKAAQGDPQESGDSQEQAGGSADRPQDTAAADPPQADSDDARGPGREQPEQQARAGESGTAPDDTDEARSANDGEQPQSEDRNPDARAADATEARPVEPGTDDSRTAAATPDEPANDDSHSRAMDRALEESAEESDATGEAKADATASPAATKRGTTAEEQAREQTLRRVPDDPGGLLRARIRRHFAENTLSKNEGVPTW